MKGHVFYLIVNGAVRAVYFGKQPVYSLDILCKAGCFQLPLLEIESAWVWGAGLIALYEG